MWYWRNLSALNRLMKTNDNWIFAVVRQRVLNVSIYVYVTGSHHRIHKSSPLHEKCLLLVIAFRMLAPSVSLSLSLARLHFYFDYYSIRVDFCTVHICFPLWYIKQRAHLHGTRLQYYIYIIQNKLCSCIASCFVYARTLMANNGNEHSATRIVKYSCKLGESKIVTLFDCACVYVRMCLIEEEKKTAHEHCTFLWLNWLCLCNVLVHITKIHCTGTCERSILLLSYALGICFYGL